MNVEYTEKSRELARITVIKISETTVTVEFEQHDAPGQHQTLSEADVIIVYVNERSKGE